MFTPAGPSLPDPTTPLQSSRASPRDLTKTHFFYQKNNACLRFTLCRCCVFSPTTSMLFLPQLLLPYFYLPRSLLRFVTFLLDEKNNQKNQEALKLAAAQTVRASVKLPPSRCALFHCFGGYCWLEPASRAPAKRCVPLALRCPLPQEQLRRV